MFNRSACCHAQKFMLLIAENLKHSPLSALLTDLIGSESSLQPIWTNTVTTDNALEFARALLALYEKLPDKQANTAVLHRCFEIYYTSLYSRFSENAFAELIRNVQNLCREKLSPKISFICDTAKQCVIIREYQRKTASPAVPLSQSSAKSKKAVYTCITGNYDSLIQHTYADPEWDYYCFTDQKDCLEQKTAGIWHILPLQYQTDNKQLTGRWHKTHPHCILPDYEQSIYIDGNINVLSPYLFEITEKNEKDTILGQFKHPVRDCIYDEILACLAGKKESRKKLENVKNMLVQNRFPPHWGLSETGILFRKHHSPLCRQLMDEWWYMLENVSVRDQVSLMFILWKNKLQPQWLCPYAYRTLKHDFAVIRHQKTLIIE